METYRAYLALLGELSNILEKLSEKAQEKTKAVRQDDLAALANILKEEQVLSLSLRSCEQRRVKLLEQLGLSQTRLDDLPGRCPEELRLEAKAVVEELRRHYTQYNGCAEVARNTLECNLHEIEKILAQENGGVIPTGLEPPPSLKTDFRA